MSSLRLRLTLLLAALLLGGAVWATAAVQRSTATNAAARMQEAESLLTAMLDQETGVRGYLLTGRRVFLQPYVKGLRDYTAADRALRAGESGNRAVLERLRSVDTEAHEWRQLAATQVVATPPGAPPRIDARAALLRKGLMDDFRVESARLDSLLDHERQHAQSSAAVLSLAISLAVFLLVGGVGAFELTRRQRVENARDDRERRYLETQSEFAETLQSVQSEEEATDLLVRHLERSRDGRRAVVLSRNNSADRLLPRTEIADDDPLEVRLVDATPSSCVAVRTGQPRASGAGDEPLLRCRLCEGLGESLCKPLLVSGEVIGSVLVRQETPLDDVDRRRVTESVAQAAPVMGNLRAIALAESRAATDALTGLPNRRGLDDALARLVAQSSRELAPLAALAIDLDHFKQVNDRHGHDVGDQALAAVARALAATVRGTDFVGRMGGEEFVVLAPDTDPDGALALAEHLRTAVARTEVVGLPRGLTVSLGLAVLPRDAADGETLLRQADRALYLAKANGRDRVECFCAVDPMPV